jgi:Holliday junction DNA helicase RuvA
LIAHLSGTLLSKHATGVVLDVGGVGYEVTIPVSTFYDLGEPGEAVRLRVYTHVREDALQLFGFRSEVERTLFLLLISVSGIGPKSALAMLSGMSADELVAAVRSNNLARLSSIPGVGKKTAERLVIELRDKVATLAPHATADEPAATAAVSPAVDDALRADALAALVQLGYQKAAAEKAVTQAVAEGGDLSVEVLLRRGLRLLSKG